MKKWLAKKLLQLIRIEWSQIPLFREPEIKVFLGDTRILLLKAHFNFRNDTWEWEEYN